MKHKKTFRRREEANAIRRQDEQETFRSREEANSIRRQDEQEANSIRRQDEQEAFRRREEANAIRRQNEQGAFRRREEVEVTEHQEIQEEAIRHRDRKALKRKTAVEKQHQFKGFSHQQPTANFIRRQDEQEAFRRLEEANIIRRHEKHKAFRCREQEEATEHHEIQEEDIRHRERQTLERKTAVEKQHPLKDFRHQQPTPPRNLPPLKSPYGRVSIPNDSDSDIFPPKVLPINHIGVWRFGGNDFITTVSQMWSVSQCIMYVKVFLRYRGDIDLWITNQCTFLEKEKSLSDYAGLTKLFVVQRPKKRDPGARYKSQEPDVTDPYWEAPENLFNYYWHQIKNGNIDVRCPSISDGNNEDCKEIWEFKDVYRLACLSQDEMLLFLSVLFTNWLERNKNVYLCPQCGDASVASCRTYFMCHVCKDRGDDHIFCRICLMAIESPSMTCKNTECSKSRKWVRSLLRACERLEIVGVHDCPKVRACPKCQCIIEFDDSDRCKHMTCPNKTCRTRFCFICLSTPNNTGYWPCGSAFDPCTPAPSHKVNRNLPV
ncbi:uncharacterized protein [Argopecten irradians]|uniref:uncharacterized protein isoform X2 n=1 Tax=Argopecten irradians TaxID=31199 RepID=UPI00370FD7D2